VKIINYSKREKLLIICLSAAIYTLFITNVSDGGWFVLPAFYGSSLLFIYGFIAFPVWRSDILEGESEKDAEFRHHFPDIHRVIFVDTNNGEHSEK